MVSRREALRLFISVLPIGLAGCTGDQSSPSTQSPTQQQSRSPTPTPEPFDPLDYVDEWHEESVRAEGEPIEIERTVESADSTTCKSVASHEALQAVRDRVGELGRMTKGTSSIDHPEYDWAITVSRQFIVRYRDHSVREKPTVEYDTLLHSTPRTITVTVVSENDTETCEYPVFVEDMVAWVGG